MWLMFWMRGGDVDFHAVPGTRAVPSRRTTPQTKPPPSPRTKEEEAKRNPDVDETYPSTVFIFWREKISFSVCMPEDGDGTERGKGDRTGKRLGRWWRRRLFCVVRLVFCFCCCCIYIHPLLLLFSHVYTSLIFFLLSRFFVALSGTNIWIPRPLLFSWLA